MFRHTAATTRRRVATLVALVITAGLPLAGLAATPAGAVTVSNETDFRNAVTAGTSPIDLANDIHLTCLGAVAWTADADLVINGNGNTLTVDSPCLMRTFAYTPAGTSARTLTIHNLTLSGGNSGGQDGGGILARSGTTGDGIPAHVVIDQGSVITANTAATAGDGGGVFGADGDVTLDHVTVSGNTGRAGGGISTPPSRVVTVTDSTISGNTAQNDGGGISTGQLSLVRTTLSGNNTNGSGGGATTFGGTVNITNSTVTGNTANATGGTGGGGLAISGSAGGAINFSTIVGNTTANTKAANVNLTGTALSFFSTVVATPLATSGTAVNCIVTNTSAGYNFSDIDDCGFGAATGDIDAGGDPLLDALANNGGPTQTRRPSATSPLRNQVPAVDCQTTLNPDVDQRSLGRPVGLCEIGAVELQLAGAPTGVAASPGNGQMSVTFTPPVSTGDGPITYTVTESPGGATATGASSPIAVAASNGAPHTFTVKATNSGGVGPDSSPSAPVTSVFQPDVQARKGATAFTDVDSYSVATLLAKTVKKNKSVVYQVLVQGDNNVADNAKLTATVAGSSKLAVTVRKGAAVVPPAGATFPLTPTGTTLFSVTVKAKTGTPKFASRTVTLTVRSLTTGLQDVVRIKTTRV